MRKAAFSLLVNDVGFTALIPADRLYERGSVPDAPALPFAVLAWGGRTRVGPGMYFSRLDLWVYDERGDYSRIDDVLGEAERVLESADHYVADGSRLGSAAFAGSSVDLFDDTYRANARSAGYRCTGNGR